MAITCHVEHNAIFGDSLKFKRELILIFNKAGGGSIFLPAASNSSCSTEKVITFQKWPALPWSIHKERVTSKKKYQLHLDKHMWRTLNRKQLKQVTRLLIYRALSHEGTPVIFNELWAKLFLTSHCPKMPIGSEMVSFMGGGSSMNLLTLRIGRFHPFIGHKGP